MITQEEWNKLELVKSKNPGLLHSTLTANEQHDIQLALLLQQLIDKQPDIIEPVHYEQFKQEKAFERGALLQAFFAIHEYLLTTKNENEQQPLINIQTHLRGLYLAPFNDTKTHNEGLVQNMEQWLSLSSDSLQDKKQAEHLCCSLHASLALIQIKLNEGLRLFGAATALKARTGIDGVQLSKEMGSLLIAIQEKQVRLKLNRALSREKSAHFQENNNELLLQDHLNQQFLHALEDNNSLGALETILTNTCTHLSALIDKRKEKAEFESLIHDLEHMANGEPNVSEKKHLNPVVKTIYRLFVPKSEASEAPGIDGVQQMKHEMNEIDDGLHTIEKNISTELCSVIAKIPTATIEKILEETQQIQTIVSAHEQLSSHANDLEKIKCLDFFIEKHNTWDVQVSNTLAENHSFFKTDTAKLIDEALQLKQKLEPIKNQYEKKLHEFYRQITAAANPQLAKSVEKSLHSSLVDVPDSIEKFKAMKGQFDVLKGRFDERKTINDENRTSMPIRGH